MDVGQGFSELRMLFNQEKTAMLEGAKVASESPDKEALEIVPFLTAMASESEELFGLTAKEVAGIPSFDDLPLVVTGATEPNPHFGEFCRAFRQFWNEEK